jgi:acylphosphatase
MEENGKKIKTFTVVLSGRVQGVGFRYFAEEKAKDFGIKGYVKNTFDNKVEVVCQGREPGIGLFISQIKKGPAFSRVTDASIQEVSGCEEFGSFGIRF